MPTIIGQFFIDMQEGNFYNKNTGEKFQLEHLTQTQLIQIYDEWLFSVHLDQPYENKLIETKNLTP